MVDCEVERRGELGGPTVCCQGAKAEAGIFRGDLVPPGSWPDVRLAGEAGAGGRGSQFWRSLLTWPCNSSVVFLREVERGRESATQDCGIACAVGDEQLGLGITTEPEVLGIGAARPSHLARAAAGIFCGDPGTIGEVDCLAGEAVPPGTGGQFWWRTCSKEVDITRWAQPAG